MAVCTMMAVTVGKAASASAAAYDCDVGWQAPQQDNEQVIPALNQCSPISLPEMPQEVPSVPEAGRLNHESPEITPLYWPARDSKASRCKSVLIYIISCTHTANVPYEFGKDIRRLSCEVKA